MYTVSTGTYLGNSNGTTLTMKQDNGPIFV